MACNFHSQFLWRVTGMPYEHLAKFSLDDFACRVRAIAPARHAQSNRAQRIAARSSALEELLPSFNEAFRLLRFSLSSMMASEVFQEAVAYSSPSAAVRLSRHVVTEKRSSDDKRRELLAIRYLQRFTTKCETAAAFGPTLAGSFIPHPISLSTIALNSALIRPN